MRGWECTVLFCDDNARFEAVQRLMQHQRQLQDKQRGLTEVTDAAKQRHEEALAKHEEFIRQADAAAAQVCPAHYILISKQPSC